MAETNYTRKDHREVAGKWGEWGGKGYESFYKIKVLKIAPTSSFDNKTPRKQMLRIFTTAP